MKDLDLKYITLAVLEWVAFILVCGLLLFVAVVGVIFFPLWLSSMTPIPWWIFLLGYWTALFIMGGGRVK